MNKSKILIVDDDLKLSRLVATILSRVGGYDAYKENRPSAVLATARQHRPDVILLDVDMPGKDGGTVGRELSEDPALADISVFFVTSLISATEACRHRGGRYLAKPVDSQLLVNTVRSLCPRLKREPQAA